LPGLTRARAIRLIDRSIDRDVEPIRPPNISIPAPVSPGNANAMRIRVYSKGKFFLIHCPDNSTVVRCLAPFVPDGADSYDLLLIPYRGREIAIPADPPELLPLLAESGRFGLSLVGEPLPDANLAGAVCPNCNENDVSWMSVDDGTNTVHCDQYGCEFGLDRQV
jgi:hypothetical protein